MADKRPWLTLLASLVVGLGAFAVLTATPALLSTRAFNWYPHILTAITLLTLAYLAVRTEIWRLTPGPLATGVFLVVVMVLFGLMLQALWGTAAGTRWLDFGLFPTHDAHDFQQTAYAILHEGTFVTPRGRPIANAVIAGLLAATGLSLNSAALITTALAGLGCWLAAIAVWRAFGLLPALLFACLLIDFFHEHLASTSSEPYGFIVGCCAFFLLLEGVCRRHRSIFVFGVFVLALAMIIRVGALFILPAMLIAGLFWFKRGRRPDWRVPLAGVVAVVAAFAIGSQASRVITPTSGGAFVNAANSWYATIVDGELALGLRQREPGANWPLFVQIFSDHPELKRMPPDQEAERKMEILTDALLSRPHAAIAGAILGWNKFIFDTSFLDFVERMWLRGPMVMLAALGLWTMVRRRQDPAHSLALVGFVAIFLSVPFLYGGGTRVHAGVVGFLALPVVVGLAHLMRMSGRAVTDDEAPTEAPMATVLTATLAGLVSTAPFILTVVTVLVYAGSFQTTAEAKLPACPAEARPVLVPFSAGSSLQIVANDQPAPNRLPRFQQRRFEAMLAVDRMWQTTRTAMAGARLAQGAVLPVVIFDSFDLVTGRNYRVHMLGRPIPRSGTTLPLCLVLKGDAWRTVDPVKPGAR